MTGLAVTALVLIALAIFYIARRSRLGLEDQVLQLFDLDAERFEVLGFDLGDGSRKVMLRGDGLIGAPDAIFKRRHDGCIVIGDYKARRFRGQPSTYERYQMVLYMGVARRRYRRPVAGLLSYGCGHVEPVAFEPETYAWLLTLRATVRDLDARFAPRTRSRRRSGLPAAVSR